MTKWNIECADVVEWAGGYEGPKFHAMLADPPYHLGKKGFMGKAWDAADYGISFQSDTWTAIAEHLHPGAFLMAFGGSRTYHRLAIAMEDAGLVIHPVVGWVTGQGFPKSTRVHRNDAQIDRLIEIWYNAVWYNTKSSPVNTAELSYLKNQIEIGMLTPSRDFVADNVVDYIKLRDQSLCVNIVEGHSGVQADISANTYIVLVNATPDQGESVLPVLTVELNSPSWPLLSSAIRITFVPVAVRTNSCGQTAMTIMAAQAPKIELGDPRFWKLMATSVGNVEAARDLKRIILNQLCSTLNLDTASTMEPLSATNVIITQFTVASLITNTVNIVNNTWEGHRYGLQALKPCLELICVAQKPYSGKPVECITGTGAGALNIDGGRVRTNQSLTGGSGRLWSHYRDGTEAQLPPVNNQGRWPPNFCLVHHFECKRVGSTAIKPLEGHRPNPVTVQSDGQIQFNTKPEGYQKISYTDPDGTETIEAWDCHPQCPIRALNEQTGGSKTNTRHMSYKRGGGEFVDSIPDQPEKRWWVQETGTVSRFYPNCSWAYEIEEQIHSADPFRYVPKASRSERDAGLDGTQGTTVIRTTQKGLGNTLARCPIHDAPFPSGSNHYECGCPQQFDEEQSVRRVLARNPHPTCKPISLTKWLATLLLPPDMYAPRRLLIPFSGVASEAIGATLAGWDHITLIEMDQSYCDIAESRLQFWNGWKERGLDEPKAILKAAKKAAKDNGGQLDLL